MKGRWSTTEAVQDRIMDAALATFGQHGYTESKLTDVVKFAGVSIGSIYHHFGGKEELFLACFDRLRNDLRADIGLDLEGDYPEAGEWEGKYLSAMWERRETCQVFLSNDTPPTFNGIQKIAEYYVDLDEKTARLLGAMVIEVMKILCEASCEEVAGVIESTLKLLAVVRVVGF